MSNIDRLRAISTPAEEDWIKKMHIWRNPPELPFLFYQFLESTK